MNKRVVGGQWSVVSGRSISFDACLACCSLFPVLCSLALAVVGVVAGATLADDSLSAREERAIKAAVARVAPSVVRIETVGGLEKVGQLLIGTGPTTGLIVSPAGHIISSAFNFIQKPSSILVTLPNGTRHGAKLVATDHSRMLVLLEIEGQDKLPVPEAAPRGEIRVGAWALAVGRTFEADQPNVSVGIVSAVDRIWGKAIQTDAKISPNNYGGPLVDISGRVLGVLVPMSPDATGEMAGVEWYDSGIGFAVPLEDILRVLPKLREGHDLRSGLLGINIKGPDMYGQPALIAAARATGPAYKAGFRPGDVVIEAAGHATTRGAELKHQLGPLYAGETIKLAAMRGNQRVEREVELAAEIEPYEFPFLGILAMRHLQDDKPDGVTVRYVYPDSPAATAGIKPGDRITSLDGQKVDKLDGANQKLSALLPGDRVKVEIRRGGETLLVEPQLGKLPESLPGELPPAHADLPAPAGDRPPVGIVPLKMPEFENECFAYVPEDYDPRLAYGAIVWLHAPPSYKQEELVERWKPLCDAHDFILVAPKSGDKTQWRPTEVGFVRRVLDEVIKNYTTDPARIVVHGHEGGAALAYLVGISNLELVRAVAAVDAPLPRMVQLPETDPVHRLAFYTTSAAQGEIAPAVDATVKRLRDMKYPVTVKDIGPQGRYLTSDELEELVRWFDALDRL